MRTVAIAFLAMLAASQAAGGEEPVFSDAAGAIRGYDPVAYFTDRAAVEGSPAHALEWRGATWHFASAAHRARFEASPERYAPRYGGYCSFAMAKGEFADIDPHAFEIVDGALYLNNGSLAHRFWRLDARSYIEQADARWEEVKIRAEAAHGGSDRHD